MRVPLAKASPNALCREAPRTPPDDPRSNVAGQSSDVRQVPKSEGGLPRLSTKAHQSDPAAISNAARADSTPLLASPRPARRAPSRVERGSARRKSPARRFPKPTAMTPLGDGLGDVSVIGGLPADDAPQRPPRSYRFDNANRRQRKGSSKPRGLHHADVPVGDARRAKRRVRQPSRKRSVMALLNRDTTTANILRDRWAGEGRRAPVSSQRPQQMAHLTALRRQVSLIVPVGGPCKGTRSATRSPYPSKPTIFFGVVGQKTNGVSPKSARIWCADAVLPKIRGEPELLLASIRCPGRLPAGRRRGEFVTRPIPRPSWS